MLYTCISKIIFKSNECVFLERLIVVKYPICFQHLLRENLLLSTYVTYFQFITEFNGFSYLYYWLNQVPEQFHGQIIRDDAYSKVSTLLCNSRFIRKYCKVHFFTMFPYLRSKSIIVMVLESLRKHHWSNMYNFVGRISRHSYGEDDGNTSIGAATEKQIKLLLMITHFSCASRVSALI